jgi:ribosomal protein L18E
MSVRLLFRALFFALVVPGLALAQRPADAALFPRPPELKEAVEFWKRVFAAYGTDQGVVHDSEDLTVVYGVESLGSRAESGRDRERQRAQQSILSRYRRTLERFANSQVDTARLFESRLIDTLRVPVKILGDGEVKKSLHVKAHAFSRSAMEKIQKAGGKCEVLTEKRR